MNAFAHASDAATGSALDTRRVLAGAIDLILVAIGGFALVTIVSMVSGGEASLSSPMVVAVMVAAALYYYFALESGDGQTVGKKVMKLRVVKADGSPVGIDDVAKRTVLRVIDGLFAYVVGLVVMMATGERRQRLGDLAAGTMVADAAAEPADAAIEAAAVATPAPPALSEAPEAVAPSKPVAPEPEPVAVEPEPEPVAAEPEPVAVEPEPVAVEPEPQPVAVEPQPVAAEPEPVAPEPAAVEPQPEPEAVEYSAPPVTDFDPYAMTQPVQDEAPAEPAAPPAEEESGGPTPEESLAALMGAAPPQPADAAAADENGAPDQREELPQQDGQGDVNVRSVETVSAIDLVMGGDDEPDDDDGPQPQVQ